MISLSPLGPLAGLIHLAFFVAEVWALVDAAMRPSSAYAAANKWTKQGWVIVLAAALVVTQFFGAFGLVALIATIVYFVDVRPALQRVSGKR